MITLYKKLKQWLNCFICLSTLYMKMENISWTITCKSYFQVQKHEDKVYECTPTKLFIYYIKRYVDDKPHQNH